jgi:hypothetical protein
MLFSFSFEYFNKARTGHKFVGLWVLGNVGITIIQEPFSDNWCLAKKGGSVKRVTEDLNKLILSVSLLNN